MSETITAGLVTLADNKRDGRAKFSECICSTLFQRKNWHIFHGNFLEIRAGAGGPVCFLLTWPPFLPSADTQDIFLSAWGGGGEEGGGVFAGAWPRA
jgi:hypothetical protein